MMFDEDGDSLWDFLMSADDKERLRSCMMFYVAEIGREATVGQLDDVCDKFALLCRQAGEVSPFAELASRRKMCAELVEGRVLDAIVNRGGEVCGWRLTPQAVQYLVNADAEMPPWVEEIRSKDIE